MAIKFLSGLNLSNVTAGSILKLDSSGNIVAAVAGTDYSTSAGLWSAAGQGGVNIDKDVRVGTYSSDVLPEARLHVYDYQTTDPKLLIEDGNTGDASMEFKISTQSYTMGIDNSDSDKFIFAASTALGTTNVLEISTAGATAFQNAVLFNDTINLPGDGTSSREVLLNAHGTRGKLMKEGNATYWQVAQGGNQFYITDAANGNDAIGNVLLRVDGNDANDNELYLVPGDGKVGVGTTDPLSTLHVNKENASSVLTISRGGTNLPVSTDIGNIDFKADYSGSPISYGGIKMSSNSISGVRSSLRFNVKSTSGSIQTGLTVQGNTGTPNVGIGTSSPSSTLHIYKSSGTTSSSTGTTLLTLENYVGSDLNNQKSFIDFVLKDNNDNETPQVRIGAEVGNNDGDASTQAEEGMGAFVVYTNNADTNAGAAGTSLAERFRIDSSGKVGIGTADPNYKLDVNGTFRSTTVYSPIVRVSGTNDHLTLRSDVQVDQGSTDEIIEFAYGSTQLGKFDQDGYLYATGFKKSGTTGFLKSDGTVDTGNFFSGSYSDLSNPPTLGTMAAAATSDYKTSDQTETYIATELGSYTATTSFGTNAFTSFSDHSTQGYLTALPSHNHDDRYYTETEMRAFAARGYITSEEATNLPVGWYTVAQNSGDRAFGEFQIWDTASSRHQSVIFNAAHHFGTDDSNSITVLGNSSFSTDVFRYIRIKENGTYDGAAIQVYIDNSTNGVGIAITGGNAQTGGWSLVDWQADSESPTAFTGWESATEKSRIDLDNIHSGGIATTGKIYAGGATTQNEVYHTGNLTPLTIGTSATTAMAGNTAFASTAQGATADAALPKAGGTMTGTLVITEGASDQTNSADTTALPSTTGAEFMRINGTYTDGRYATEFAKVDRGGNLPLYIRQSKSTANSFANIARFGDHTNSVHEFEVFGSIKATSGDSGDWNTAYTYSQVGHLPLAGGTVTGTLKLDSELQFLRGSAEYSNYIRAANYPSQNYTSSTAKYWLEYGAKGGHHFVLNTDGGAGSVENAYDDFTIWNGAVDGDRLLEVTNAGNVTTAGKLYIGTTSATTTATTALFLGASNEVKKRSLGSNAFNSTSFLPLAGGTITGQAIFPSASTTKPVLPNGYIARNDTADTDGTHDIWGISERYYPSNSTDGDAWGIQWSGTPNEINFIGAGQKKLSIDLDTAGTVKIDGNAVATESYVGTQISNLVDSSPAALNTLNELAAALGDDASFSTTMSTALGNRLRIDVNNQSLSSTELTNARTNLGLGTAATAASTAFVAVSGDSMTGNLGINSSTPQAPLDVQPNSSYKVTKVGDDRTSHYKLTGAADHTLTLSSGSYHSSEVVITAHQTNGGTNNNLYIRGIWTNNHTSHHWHEIENIGGLSGSSFTITNGQSGDTENSGELEIVHDYVSGSFGQMVVRVTDHYGTHSYTIS